jgi:hypothetical protein
MSELKMRSFDSQVGGMLLGEVPMFMGNVFSLWQTLGKL